MPYKVRLLPEAERSLAALQPKQQRQVASKKLQGSSHLYRIPSGNFRIIYQIHDDVLTVLVVRIGNRKDVYRRLPACTELDSEQ